MYVSMTFEINIYVYLYIFFNYYCILLPYLFLMKNTSLLTYPIQMGDDGNYEMGGQ